MEMSRFNKTVEELDRLLNRLSNDVLNSSPRLDALVEAQRTLVRYVERRDPGEDFCNLRQRDHATDDLDAAMATLLEFRRHEKRFTQALALLHTLFETHAGTVAK